MGYLSFKPLLMPIPTIPTLIAVGKNGLKGVIGIEKLNDDAQFIAYSRHRPKKDPLDVLIKQPGVGELGGRCYGSWCQKVQEREPLLAFFWPFGRFFLLFRSPRTRGKSFLQLIRKVVNFVPYEYQRRLRPFAGNLSFNITLKAPKSTDPHRPSLW